SHGTDHLVQHDQLGHFAVRPSGQQFGGGGNYRIGRRNRDEIFQLSLAVFISAGNAHHIVGVLLHHIRVELCQLVPHAQGGVLDGTEHDGLGHAVGAFQILGNLLGYLPDAVLNDDVVVVIAIGVDPVGDLLAVDVPLTLAWPPALTNVDHH